MTELWADFETAIDEDDDNNIIDLDILAWEIIQEGDTGAAIDVLLLHPCLYMRWAAVWCLGLMGDEQALPALQATLRDPDSDGELREQALCAISLISPAVAAAIRRLRGFNDFLRALAWMAILDKHSREHAPLEQMRMF